MNLIDLQAMSAPALAELFNSVSEARVKKFENKTRAVERTAAALRAAGKLEEEVAQAIEHVVEAAAPVEKMEKPKATKKPKAVKKEPVKAKREKTNSVAAVKAEVKREKKAETEALTIIAAQKRGRGRPLIDYAYTALSNRSKFHNPGGVELRKGSDRFLVLQEVIALPGVTKTALVKAMPHRNVLGSLDYLVRHGFLTAKA